MKHSAVIKLLRDLVAIPSVNPQGEPGTDKTGEAEIAAFVAQRLRRMGADVEFQYAEPDRPTVIGKLAARGRAKRAVAFAPHTDTVSVAGMTIEPFKPVVRGDKLYGRGAADTKGSLAAFLAAMERAARSRAAREHDIYLIALMGEESGNDGAKFLMRHKWPKLLGKLDFVIVGEPTELDIVNAHKGSLWFRATTRGRACHGAMPEHGENAITKMTRIIGRLERDFMPRLARRRHPVLGCATMNIGTIRGGTKVNIVPDRCAMEVDLRTLPGDDHVAMLRKLRAMPGRPEVEVMTDCAGLQTPAGNPFVRQLVAAGGGRCVGAPWFCDAAVFAERGVQAVAFGPGSIKQGHTKDEFTSISQVERCEVIIGRFLENLP
ncbi:MAG: ArgE/DapE family deacylase [Verrucomicrobia bacterium]|nr:ArgE/DapE family deacylase [Verrucomicrobiota bacterium]